MMVTLRELFAAGMTIGACVAVGYRVLRRFAPGLAPGEARLLAFVPGGACLGPLFYALAWAGWARPGVVIALQLACIVASVRRPERESDKPARDGRRWSLAFAPVFAGFSLLYVAQALRTPATPAGSGRLRALVALVHGRGFTPGIEAGLPGAVDALFVPALAFRGQAGHALVRVAFLLLLPWLMLAWARRREVPAAGFFGAILVFAAPAVGYSGSSDFTGVALATILFSLFYLLDAGAPSPLVGLTAGFACGASYAGFLSLPYVCVVLAWRRRWRSLAVACGLALLVASPWIARNAIVLGDPSAPFFAGTFPNPYVTELGEHEYVLKASQYTEVVSPVEVPLQAAILGGSLGAPIGPVFLLAPFALLVLRLPIGWRLLFATAVLGASYPLNPGTRFLVPVLPFVSLAMGLVFMNARVAGTVLLFAHLILSIPGVSASCNDPDTPQIRGSILMPFRLLGRAPSGPVLDMLDQARKSRVFALSPTPQDQLARDIVVAGQSAEASTLVAALRSATLAADKPVVMREIRFDRRRFTTLTVRAAGAAPAGWRIAEMRFFSGDSEIPRSARWRLRASANPWTAGQAFDNSPVTFWTSARLTERGTALVMDFGAPVELDRIELLGPNDQRSVTLTVDGIASVTTDATVAPPLGMRRAAVRELRARGFEYVLAADSDFAAASFREEPGLWGISEVGQAGGFRLYRIFPRL